MTNLLLAAALLIPPPLLAQEKDGKPKEAAAADKVTVDLASYFLTVPTSEANPKLVDAFLAIDPATLPKGMRVRTEAKQLEINTLVRVHDTVKAGVFVTPAETADESSFIKPMRQYRTYEMAGYMGIDEDELKYIMDKTKCTEIDLGTKFTLRIFTEHGKPRKLMLHEKDPLAAMVAQSHSAGGQTKFFGIGFNCQH